MKKFINKSSFQNDRFNLIFIAFAASVMILPVLFWGIPDGYDLPHHYQCVATILDTFKSGDFYSSWSLNRNYGYGGLEARMYPPISHYVLALFKFVTGNWHIATWLTYSFWWILGCFGVYYLAKEFTTPQNALFAAVLFSIIPYRINEIYQTFLYAEFAAGSILPFCFLYLTRIIKEVQIETKASKKILISNSILGFAISIAALVLTHLPLTLIGIIALGIYFLSQIEWKLHNFAKTFAKVSIGGLLGLAASSFFWIKVLQERFMMAKTSIHEELEVHYEFNFLLTPIQTYDEISWELSFVPFFYDLVLLLTILIALPLAIIGLRKYFTSAKDNWLGVWIVFGFSVFITTILSKPLWDNLPFLFEVQFPWRWLNIVSIFATVLAAGGFSICLNWFQDEKTKNRSVIVFGVFIIALTLSLSWAISTAKYIQPKNTDYRIDHAIKGESFKFWGTIWAEQELKDARPEKVFVENRKVKILEWTDTKREFEISPGEAKGQTRVSVFYHPNWKVSINNESVQTQPDSYGAITFEIPKEESIVSLKFVESFEVKTTQNISLAAWTLLLLLLIFLTIKKVRSKT